MAPKFIPQFTLTGLRSTKVYKWLLVNRLGLHGILGVKAVIDGKASHPGKLAIHLETLEIDSSFIQPV